MLEAQVTASPSQPKCIVVLGNNFTKILTATGSFTNRCQKLTAARGLGRVKTFRPRETGDAKLNLACCRNCELESTWLARSAISVLVAPMRTPHVRIAAMRGFTPRMFMARVRL